MRKTYLALLALCALASACGMGKDEIGGREFDTTLRDVDSHISESRTLSALAKLEEAVGSYYKAEGRLPERLEDLVPKYLGEMPTLELALRGHRNNNNVQAYPSLVIRDGQIDGTQLKDTGRWGYAHNERQAIIFVDCTHMTSRGTPWYQERGVY